MSPTPSLVYRNLRTGTWSLLQRGRVVAHPSFICIHDATFVVRPGGRQAVLATRKKNVHAFVRGTPCEKRGDCTESRLRQVTYDPYRGDSFIDVLTGQNVQSAEYVELREDHTVWAGQLR